MPLYPPTSPPRTRASGKWYSVPGGISSASVATQSRLNLTAFDVEVPCIVQSMGVEISAGAAASFVQMGFYRDSNGYPVSPLSTIAVSDTTAASGNAVATGLSIALSPGRWWAACNTQGGAATLFGSGGSNNNDPWMPMGVQGQVFAEATFQSAVASTSTPFPDPFVTAGDTHICPFIQIRIA